MKKILEQDLGYYYKEVWNGKDWILEPLCENATKNFKYGSWGIGVMQCYNNPQEKVVTVDYGQGSEVWTTRLCKECAERLTISAKRNGYKVQTRSCHRQKFTRLEAMNRR